MEFNTCQERLFGVPGGLGAVGEPGGVVVFGAPYEGASFNPAGAALGPGAIRAASLLAWCYRHDHHLDGCMPFFAPEDGGLSPLTGNRIIDVGDLALSHESPEEAAEVVSAAVGQWLRGGAGVLGLLGDHSLTYGMVSALAAQGKAGVIFFDAHLDASPLPSPPLSHGTWASCCRQLPGVSCVAQVGLRSPQPWPESMGEPMRGMPSRAFSTWGVDLVLPAAEFSDRGIDALLDQLPEGLNWHISLDVDVLDPMVMPCTGVPVPLGLWPQGVLSALRRLCARLPVASMDICEFAPSQRPAFADMAALTLSGLAVGMVSSLAG